MVQADINKGSYKRELNCVDCGDKVKLPVPMITHKVYNSWVCGPCAKERELGIENTSRFLKWLRKRKR